MDGQNKIAAILLAAGGSSRLGRPKQLVEFEGKTLIRRAAKSLVDAGCSPVVVVLGFEAAACNNQLAGLPVVTEVNADWPAGMSSSIAVGLRALEKQRAHGVLIALCDQPHVTVDELTRLIAAFAKSGGIAASAYASRVGVPAVFASKFIPLLKTLEGDRGARVLIGRHRKEVTVVAMPAAAIDVDTPEDLLTIG